MRKGFGLPPASSSNFLQKVRELLATSLGQQGDPLDRSITLRDLVTTGIAKVKPGYGAGVAPGGGPLPIDPGAGIYTPDLTPPPQPTGFLATASTVNVLFETDEPVFKVGNGHLRTVVYGVAYATGDPLPTFSSAIKVTEFTGSVFAHPLDPGSKWRYWATWVTRDGVEGLPAGGTNGIEATTGLIDDAKIANLAVSTAKIADLAVSRAKIVNAAIGDAQLDSLAVTTAKIGDAAVSTLKIAGQAVTIPTSAFTQAANYYYPPASTTVTATIEIQTLTFVSTGAPVYIIFTCDLLFTGTPLGPNMECAMQIQVSVSGGAWTTIYTGVTRRGLFSDNDFRTIAISMTHTPGAATVTYRAVARITSSDDDENLSFYNKSLFCLETKR